MTWNYRVIEFVDPSDEPWRAIFEVYYDDAGNPNGYNEDPAEVVSSDAEGVEAGLGWVLDRMREALAKPILVEHDFHRTPQPHCQRCAERTTAEPR
jgi:hypothetical protein